MIKFKQATLEDKIKHNIYDIKRAIDYYKNMFRYDGEIIKIISVLN